MKFTSAISLALLAILPNFALSIGLRGDGQASLDAQQKSRSLMSDKDKKDSRNSYVSYIKKDDFYFRLRDSKFRGKCLTFDPKDDYYLKFEDCHDDSKSAYQDWYYDPHHYTINSFHYNYRDWCVTLDNPRSSRRSDRAGYLYLEPCKSNNVYQRWYETSDYRYESGWDRNQCMDYCRDCGDYVHTRECDWDHDKDQQYFYGDKFRYY
jgi:hypothetical protein